jgi:hypothetical protein
LPHLPPTIQPNGFLAVPPTTGETSEDGTALEAVELTDSPKTGLSTSPTNNGEPKIPPQTVSIKEIQATAFNALKPSEKLSVLEQAIQETDLQFLWNGVVERNPVVRFSLEKIALPVENHNAHSSQFLRKSLSVLISGAALGSTLVMPGGGYQSMGVLAGSQAVQNLVNGRTKPISTLTPTEHIQLANLVDDLKRQLVENYQTYQQNLRNVQQAQLTTQRAFQQYERAKKNQNPLELLTTMQVYHQTLKREMMLKQQTKLARIKLERLSGEPTVAQLVLVPQARVALQKTKEPNQATVLAFPAVQPLMPEPAEKLTPSVHPKKLTSTRSTPLSTNKKLVSTSKPTVQPSVMTAIKQTKPLKLLFKEDALF